MEGRWPLICGAISGPLFMLIVLIEGAARADYSSVRHPVSSLAFGDAGWVQSANFIITGMLSLPFAVRLHRLYRSAEGAAWGPELIAASAICLTLTGFFLTDPFSGYPPGTPGHPLHYSLHGIIHTAVSSAAFVSLSAACFVFGRYFRRSGERGWARYSIASGLGTVFFFFCEILGMNQVEGFVEVGGLLQRLSIIISMAWLTLLAIKLLNAHLSAPKGSPHLPRSTME